MILGQARTPAKDGDSSSVLATPGVSGWGACWQHDRLLDTVRTGVLHTDRLSFWPVYQVTSDKHVT